jgi:hypothetical protein
VVLGQAPDEADLRHACTLVSCLGSRADVLWTSGPEVQSLYRELGEAGFSMDVPGKGRSVWTAFWTSNSLKLSTIAARIRCTVVSRVFWCRPFCRA